MCHIWTISSNRSSEQGRILKKATLLSELWPNLAHSFCGGLLIHLLDKLGEKTIGYGTTLGGWGEKRTL
jgi:hypothetical protein